MRKYEVMFIIRPMEEEPTNQIIDKFLKLIEKNGGTVDKEDRWGKRQLAYEIKDCTEGYYDLLYVTAEPACMDEADRVFKITDGILKHMIVRSEGPAAEAEAEAEAETAEEPAAE